MSRVRVAAVVMGVFWMAGCAEEISPQTETAIDDPNRTELAHSFGSLTVDAYGEITPCVSWTLDNDEPLYVERVTLSNGGGFHHSNWFVVPESDYSGPDGFWDCDERNFSELEAAIRGTVLFAQSTQSRVESQFLDRGVVIKIPPRHRVIGGLHVLNLGASDLVSELRMGLQVVHPSEVDVVVSPMRLTFYDLNIHPQSFTTFTAECDLREALGDPPDARLYWLLPHYHGLGSLFQVSILGGPRNGEMLLDLDGFNAEANGQAYRPPVDLSDINGLRVTCGFTNPRDEFVQWGIGDQEMCVMLAFIEGPVMVDGFVDERELISDEGDRQHYGGECRVFAVPKNAAQSMPTEAEIAGDFVVPLSDAPEDNVPVIPECVDTPADAVALTEATLTAIRDSIFVPSCSFSSCHGGENPAYGLDLTADDLHAELMSHPVETYTDMRLIEPGNPERSLLYQRVSRCQPVDKGGSAVANMPRNAPTLLDPALVALIRDWIAAGAPDN